MTDITCPNGCCPSNLVYEQDEVTLVSYNVVTVASGQVIVDWSSVAREQFLEPSETERFLICLGCGVKRFASVRWDGTFEYISDRPEPH